MIKRWMVLTLALLASACTSQTQALTNAQMQFERYNEIVNNAGSASQACYAEVDSHPDSVVAKELLPLDDSTKASITQLASTARPTPDRIAKIASYLQSLEQCDVQYSSEMVVADSGYSQIVRQADQGLDDIIVQLIHGEINLGEAARAAKSVVQNDQEEFDALNKSIVMALVQQNNAEMAQRQAAQAQGEADLAAFGATMQSDANQFQQQQEQLLQATTSFQPIQVMPITPPGGDQIRCINVGIYTNCRY